MYRKIVPIFVVLAFTIPVASGSKSKRTCSALEIQDKSCRLQAFGYEIVLNQTKFHVNNGVRRMILEMPIQDMQANWSQFRLSKIGGQYLLEMYLWSVPKTEAQLQSLQWFVYKIDRENVEKKIDQQVRYRRAILTNDSQEKTPMRYGYDPMEHHGIKAKGDKVFWFYRNKITPL